MSDLCRDWKGSRFYSDLPKVQLVVLRALRMWILPDAGFKGRDPMTDEQKALYRELAERRIGEESPKLGSWPYARQLDALSAPEGRGEGVGR
jgi:hypothetical protein